MPITINCEDKWNRVCKNLGVLFLVNRELINNKDSKLFSSILIASSMGCGPSTAETAHQSKLVKNNNRNKDNLDVVCDSAENLWSIAQTIGTYISITKFIIL